MTLTEFLLARIAEDEAAARAVPPLDHNFDMGGKRHDERFVFDRTLPSSADGMGNWSKHRDGTTAAHFSRHDPARALAECEAKRRIVALHGDVDPCDAHDGATLETVDCETLRALALPYSDHPDYDEAWRP